MLFRSPQSLLLLFRNQQRPKIQMSNRKQIMMLWLKNSLLKRQKMKVYFQVEQLAAK